MQLVLSLYNDLQFKSDIDALQFLRRTILRILNFGIINEDCL